MTRAMWGVDRERDATTRGRATRGRAREGMMMTMTSVRRTRTGARTRALEDEDEYAFKAPRNKNLDRDNPELEERFAVIGQGDHQCQSCMYEYKPKVGDEFYPVAAGTQFKDLPSDWRCPTCGADKSKFKSLGKRVAGFEQNQGYGLGTNSMTEGEKSQLIYGALAFFFACFIAGYLLD